ncbi:MAG TPA: thiamine diphosphokinase [Ilumatobacteraceae bacterium]|nr:thiamine diphosphokinase [Ilumatobacteraceae bacterium]
MNEHIVIITGASPLDADLVARLRGESSEHTVWMAVDGGLDHALAAGLEPTHLVGDLDSVTEEGLAWAARHAEISRHPTDKDQTDTELALALAAKFDPERITLVGGGDRLDHTIAGIGALGALSLTSVPVLEGWWDGQHIRVVHGPGSATLQLVPGSTLSLLALHGPCVRVTLSGARWQLDHFTLEPLVGMGVSNEVPDVGAASSEIEVTLAGGVLTIFDDPVPESPDDPRAMSDEPASGRLAHRSGERDDETAQR